VRIIRLSTIRSLEQICGLNRVAIRPDKTGANYFAFCQLLQLSKNFGPEHCPKRSAPGGTFEYVRTENKKPGVERRANPPANKHKRLRAMLDSILSGIRNWPHFEPREGSIETRSSPDSRQLAGQQRSIAVYRRASSALYNFLIPRPVGIPSVCGNVTCSSLLRAYSQKAQNRLLLGASKVRLDSAR
jgi:hypothetical protein